MLLSLPRTVGLLFINIINTHPPHLAAKGVNPLVTVAFCHLLSPFVWPRSNRFATTSTIHFNVFIRAPPAEADRDISNVLRGFRCCGLGLGDRVWGRTALWNTRRASNLTLFHHHRVINRWSPEAMLTGRQHTANTHWGWNWSFVYWELHGKITQWCFFMNTQGIETVQIKFYKIWENIRKT